MGDGRAENGHDLITDDVEHGAANAANFFAHAPGTTMRERFHVLGVHLL